MDVMTRRSGAGFAVVAKCPFQFLEQVGFGAEMAEMLVAEKLASDIKNMVLKGVLVEFKEVDLMYIIIDFGIGVFEGDVAL